MSQEQLIGDDASWVPIKSEAAATPSAEKYLGMLGKELTRLVWFVSGPPRPTTRQRATE